MLPTFSHLDRCKALLDQHRPLPPAMVKNLRDDLVLRWTYHSNAIEGNTLTLMETKVVLEGITVGGKSLREHFEAVNHVEAIGYLEDCIRQHQPLSERLIKEMHQLILTKIDNDNAGSYRKVDVLIAGASHRPPSHLQVEEEMAAFFRWYQGEAQTLHPVVRAALVHSRFVNIHPFVDANGRTSRLLLNFELMKAGFPPVIIEVGQRLAYYQALDQAAAGDEASFVELIAEAAKRAFANYWFVLGIKAPE